MLGLLTKTTKTPDNGISLSDFRCSLSAIAIMSELTWHYPLNCCTFLSSGLCHCQEKQWKPKAEPNLFELCWGASCFAHSEKPRFAKKPFTINHAPELTLNREPWTHFRLTVNESRFTVIFHRASQQTLTMNHEPQVTINHNCPEPWNLYPSSLSSP